MIPARTWIDSLQLIPHPEGGHYREGYRAAETIRAADLPPRFGGERCFSTAIYFLLERSDFSAFHRIQQDEVWHHYYGSPVAIHVIEARGDHSRLLLGADPAAAILPQQVVRGGLLFAAEIVDKSGYALVGCTVAPGFDFADWSLPSRSQLLGEYPQHRELITRLTRA
jgi:predicted cupin superfamily sugar epimerase